MTSEEEIEMKQTSIVLVASLATVAALAQTAGFGTDSVGSVPAGWSCGVTGRGNPPGLRGPRWA